MRHFELTEQNDPQDGDKGKFGYWRKTPKSPSEYRRPPKSSQYPWPVESNPWPRQEEFLKNLKIVQEHNPPTYKEMGYSTCRLCGGVAGSGTFFIDGIGSWPSGYIHYIKEHNIVPPKQFIDKINSLSEQLS